MSEAAHRTPLERTLAERRQPLALRSFAPSDIILLQQHEKTVGTPQLFFYRLITFFGFILAKRTK